MRRSFRRQLLDGLPHFMRGGIRRHRVAKRDRDRIRNALGPLPEETAALEAEDAAPQTVQGHRDDGNIEALYDSLHAPLERQDVLRPADGSFREYAHHVTGGQFLPPRANGFYRSAPAAYRNRVGLAE